GRGGPGAAAATDHRQGRRRSAVAFGIGIRIDNPNAVAWNAAPRARGHGRISPACLKSYGSVTLEGSHVLDCGFFMHMGPASSAFEGLRHVFSYGYLM